MFSQHWIKVMDFRQKYQRSDFVSFICAVSGVLIYCIVDGINLDHLVKVLPGFSTVKLLFSPFN